MKDFFEKNTLKKIKDSETGISEVKNFLSIKECEEVLSYLRNLSNKSSGSKLLSSPLKSVCLKLPTADLPM